MSDERRFEDLTLAQFISQFLTSPMRTWRSLRAVMDASTENVEMVTLAESAAAPGSRAWWGTDLFSAGNARLMLYLLAVVCGVSGNALLHGAGNAMPRARTPGMEGSLLWLAVFIWLMAELVGHWTRLQAWWQGMDRPGKHRWIARLLPAAIGLGSFKALVDSMSAPAKDALDMAQTALIGLGLAALVWLVIEMISRWIRRQSAGGEDEPSPSTSNPAEKSVWQRMGLTRATLFILAAAASGLVWVNTSDNTIAPPIIVLWLISTLLWALAFAPLGWNFFDWAAGRIDALRRVKWRRHLWAIIAFVLIMMLGMGFRLAQLEAHPPEINSDLVEKIRDSYLVAQGEYRIFFSNNGGREPLQFYLMAILGSLPGLGFNHFTLKLLSVIEGLITLPVLVMVGVELMGGRRRRFGILVGLILAGLVAVSYWHAVLSRLGLRIVLAPLFTSLVLIYLARAMRHNRRADYVKTALALGFGLYGYQAVRMLPIAVAVGVVMAMVIRPIAWRVRLTYFVNLAVLVFVAWIVFLPLFHYSLEDPGNFWMRTSGRMLGDSVPNEERLAALSANVPILMSNIRNALLMFHWRGDITWLHGLPLAPAMDIYTGAFLLLGLAAWGVRMVKSRDAVLWFVPLMAFIMLLPSALAIAFPIENPSHTRASGALPLVYLLAALPIAIIARRLRCALGGRRGMMLAAVFCGAAILLANHDSTRLYFDRYPPAYIEASYPYSEAGLVLRGFAESGGAYGNAFIIAYPHFWDHRAVGIEAGQPLWPNSILGLSDVPQFLGQAQQRADAFKLHPNRDLLFFYSVDDRAASLQLHEWFPNGHEQKVQSSHPDDSYMLYRVPALGKTAMAAFLNRH